MAFSSRMVIFHIDWNVKINSVDGCYREVERENQKSFKCCSWTIIVYRKYISNGKNYLKIINIDFN